MARDVWVEGDAYEVYVGRWSRRVAEVFLTWLEPRPGLRWLDVGCGTGALSVTVLERADPAQVTGVDPSEPFLVQARRRVGDDARATFHVGDARSLPLPDDAVDVVVSGLAVNFVPEPDRALAEFVRVLVPGGVAAAYVWDYAEGMEMMKRFWDVAAELNPTATDLDEGRRFPLCRPEPLGQLWTESGLTDVTVRPVDIPMVFADFDDYWRPFLGGQGPAPAYAMSLSEPDRAAVRERLRATLPAGPDGSIALTARAWAVRGTAA
jgi:SAM-dependent methyltransferase